VQQQQGWAAAETLKNATAAAAAASPQLPPGAWPPSAVAESVAPDSEGEDDLQELLSLLL